jgi:glycerol-3-phosphate acyltransferase PlsY
MPPSVGLLIAYVAGSIPAAYLAGKLLRGIDLREHGSGNLGATNVLRVMGAKIAALVMAVDVLKGALPVALLPRLTDAAHGERWAVAFGIAAIVGHVRPVFLLWRGGGKGVATAAGVFLALAPWGMLAALVVWAGVMFASGYVSLASLSAAVVLPVAIAIQWGIDSLLFAVSATVALFVFWTHRSNIARLRRGEEFRFGRKKTL